MSQRRKEGGKRDIYKCRVYFDRIDVIMEVNIAVDEKTEIKSDVCFHHHGVVCAAYSLGRYCTVLYFVIG